MMATVCACVQLYSSTAHTVVLLNNSINFVRNETVILESLLGGGIYGSYVPSPSMALDIVDYNYLASC